MGCSEADAARIPLGSDDAEEYKKWFQSLGIKFLAIVPLAKYVDTDGACVAAIRANDQLNGFWERNEKDSAFPGLEEKRQMYAFTDSMASRAGAVRDGAEEHRGAVRGVQEEAGRRPDHPDGLRRPVRARWEGDCQ